MISVNTIGVVCIITGAIAFITGILGSYKKILFLHIICALSALIFIITMSCAAFFGMNLQNNDIAVNEDITASYKVVEHQVVPTSFVIVKSTNGDKTCIEFSLDDTEIVEGDKYEWQDVARTYKYGFIYQPDDNVKHRLIIPKNLVMHPIVDARRVKIKKGVQSCNAIS